MLDIESTLLFGSADVVPTNLANTSFIFLRTPKESALNFDDLLNNLDRCYEKRHDVYRNT